MEVIIILCPFIYLCEGQSTTCEKQFSPYSMWALGREFALSGLVVCALSSWLLCCFEETLWPRQLEQKKALNWELTRSFLIAGSLVASRRAECWSSNWEILILISKQQAERERERLTDKHWTWDILKIKPRTKNSNVWAYRAHSYSNHHILLPAEPFYLFVNIILIINRLNSIIIMQSYFNISF